MDSYRRSIVEETARLQDDPGLGWSSLRGFLTARGINASRAIVAIVFPDDVRRVVAVIVISTDRLFAVDIEYPEGVDFPDAMKYGWIVGWEDDAALLRRENQPFVDLALEMVSPD